MYTLLFLSSFSLMSFSSCAQNEPSQKENMKEWLEGYAYSSSYEGDFTMNNHFYEDTSKNELEINEDSIEFSYEFDQKTYDNFDITTENHYYGNVTFIVEGQNFLFSESILVGEKYTNSMAKGYLANLDNFLISSSKETSQYIALYTDKEMTVPFEEMTIEEVKLVVPEDKSTMITLFKRQDGLIRIQ